MTTPSSIGELIAKLRFVDLALTNEAADTLERLRDALTPFANKATLAEEARETWKPSLGPLGDDYTVSVKLKHCRDAREALTAKGNRGDD